MPPLTRLLAVIASVVLCATLAATATARPVVAAQGRHPSMFVAKRSGTVFVARRRSTTVFEHLRRNGLYEVGVTVTAGTPGDVNLRIGASRHHARISRRRRVTVRQRVAIRNHRLKISVTGRRGAPKLSVTLRKLAGLNRRNAGGKPATGSTAPVGPVAPVTAPVAAASAPAPLGVGTAGVTLPAGFAPLASYTNPARSYQFTGSSLPADWSAGTSSYGFAATQFQPSQVTMTGSSAALTAIKQASPQGDPYESGWISTAGKYTFQYGMVDFRAQMPAGQGLWSGLWLDQANGSNPWGELDVQEMLLSNTTQVYGSAHGWAPGPTWYETQYTNLSTDASQGFHDYQLIWQPGLLTWAVDGHAYAQYSKAQALAAGRAWPFDSVSEYLIADLAVAGPSEWGGAPTAATTFPAAMTVQSVQVWQ